MTGDERQARKKAGVVLAVLLVSILGLIAGAIYLGYTAMQGGKAANVEALNAWIAAARAGTARRPTEPGPTTDAALRAVSTSVSSEITRATGSYGWGGGTTCFEVTLSAPGKSTNVTVRVSGDRATPFVDVAGVSPDCTCKSKGAVAERCKGN